MTQKRDTSREYVFKGTLALRNVTFYVEAKDENEAKLNALNGKYVRWEAAPNEPGDCEIEPTSCELH